MSTHTLTIAAFLSMFMLTACATNTPVAVCPAIVPYSDADQTRAADELDSLPAGAVLRRFIADYGELRAKLRACQ